VVVKEIGFRGVDWIFLTQLMDQPWTLTNSVINLIVK
jgi:hypothetical protein